MVQATRRNRRIIEDDEDEKDAGNGNTDNHEADAMATSMVDRLKRRAAKAAEAAHQKRMKLKNNEEGRESQKKSSPTNPRETEPSIPKKTKKVTTIPKKLTDKTSSNGSSSDGSKKDTATPSLLSEMKKPVAPKTDSSKGTFRISAPNNRGAIAPRKSPQRLSPVPTAVGSHPSSNNRPETTNLTPSPGPTEPDSSVKDPVVGKERNLGSGLRQLVWDGLRDMCEHSFPKPPERNGVDLFASFLRHKDLLPKLDSGNLDSNNNNLRYDFFDVDEISGNIVLQQKIPIFPEEFPPGTQEWPLSWWGIVDPSVEKNDAETKETKTSKRSGTHNKDEEANRSKSRRDRMDDSGNDRSRRNEDHSMRKRSSRDRYDDYYDYHDDYAFRDARRGGRYSSGENYRDFRGDGSPGPNNWDPSQSSSHRRGGPPFPRRARDGPEPRSRSHPRDGGEYRGEPRGHPGYGRGAPGNRMDFPDHDAYDVQGRHPLSPPHHHDDFSRQRNHHREDRNLGHGSRRGPYPSNPVRDDDRNSGRYGGRSLNRRDR